jgi:hypothetical protein
MFQRAQERVTFAKPLASRSNIQDWIGESRIELEMVRRLTLKTARLMDTVGNRHAHVEIAAIKVAAAEVALGSSIRRSSSSRAEVFATTSRSPSAISASWSVFQRRRRDGPLGTEWERPVEARSQSS